MPRKRSTPSATAAAADPSGFDVPPAASTTAAPSTAKPPSGSPEPDDEPAAATTETPPTQEQAKPSPINATAIVTVPKQAFLRMQKLQTAKARQEQLRILARKHPVVRDLIKQLKEP